MAHSIEIEVAFLWSIKKETFMENNNDYISSERNQTAIPGYEYFFEIEQDDGYVGIYFQDSSEMENSKIIKELTLTIPSANLKANLSKDADVPEGHIFRQPQYGPMAIFQSEDILNPEKNFFVDDILNLEFRGIVECNKEPNTKSLGKILWNAKDKDFTFIIGKQEIKVHKFILRQYSSVFSDMFNSNINQIKVNHYNFYTVCNTLRCCYDLPIIRPSVDLLFECLRFADTYDMPVIKERISNQLATYLNTENVCKLANKSLEYNAPTLKDYCISFISKCKRDGKQYDDALNLHLEIVHELYKSSLFRTETS